MATSTSKYNDEYYRTKFPELTCPKCNTPCALSEITLYKDPYICKSIECLECNYKRILSIALGQMNTEIF